MLRCRKFDVVIAWRGTLRKLAKVMFGKDGSFYVMFPGFRNYPGIASHVVMPATPEGHGSRDYNLADAGRVTSHMVKYSHHPDGRAHFSQDGKVVTTIRRTAASLSVQSGHVFTIQIQNVEALSVATAPRPQMVSFAAPDDTFALKLLGYRFQSSALQFAPDAGAASEDGTDVQLLIDDGASRKLAAIRGAPGDAPLSDRVLAVTCEVTPPLTIDRDDNLIFLGGFDLAEVALNHGVESGFLAMAYPCSDFEGLCQSIGHMDFVGRTQ